MEIEAIGYVSGYYGSSLTWQHKVAADFAGDAATKKFWAQLDYVF